jgi:hypothetical protein
MSERPGTVAFASDAAELGRAIALLRRQAASAAAVPERASP